MSIRFRCDRCGRPFEVRDEFAGKTARCKRCGELIRIPDAPDADVYALDDAPAHPPMPETEPGPSPGSARGGWTTRPISDPGPSRYPDPASPQDEPMVAKPSILGAGGIKGALGIALVIAMIGLKIYARTHRGVQVRNPPPQAAEDVARASEVLPSPDDPVALPGFPDAGPGREIEPGILLREVQFRHAGPDIIPLPGHTAKIWVYTPAGDHPAGSLPCVMIARTGETVAAGAKLDEWSHPDHLPYARAGFAVMAFETDGSVPPSDKPSDLDLSLAGRRFLRSGCGLANARIALEYARARLPEIDPGRVAAAGHGTAGTMALRFAEHEPRLRACVAFAPDLVQDDFSRSPRVAALKRSGIGLGYGPFTPRWGIKSLACPVFLFHARDDREIPARDTREFAEALRSEGKTVSLKLVASGGHRDAMTREGLPLAIEWLRETLGQAPSPAPEAEAPGPD